MNGEPPLLTAVLDTNVFVSGAILSRGAPYEILEAWRRQAFILVTSEAIIAEIERVMRYPHLRDRYGLDESRIERLAASLRTDALVVPGVVTAGGATADPADDKFIACALEADAGFVVSGDRHLLSLKRYQHIQIVGPASFLERLLASPGAPGAAG